MKGIKQIFERSVSNSWRFISLLTVFVASMLVLTACGGSNESRANPTELTKTEENVKQEETVVKEKAVIKIPKQATPIACKGIILEVDSVVAGEKLGECMMEAMLAVETGSQRFESSDGTNSVVDFQWKPEFSMHVKNGDNSIVLKENTGWIKLSGGKWIEETDTSEDIDTILAVGTLKLARVFSSPQVMTQYIALGSSWRVLEETSVPAEDAFVDVAWKLVPEAPIVVEGITISNMELYLTTDYLGAYYVSTGTVAGISTTSSNTFLQWGGPVTIPNPTKDL